MVLAVQVYPQTNSTDKTTIGYKLAVYDPKNRDKVIGSEGEYKDTKGDYSYGKFVNVGFADSVKLGILALTTIRIFSILTIIE